MNLLYAIFLGFLQGATEFLPISSSGHLVLAEHFMGVKGASLAFDVTLHLGTLLAVLLYFRQDFLQMALAWWPGRQLDDETRSLRRMALMIVVGTVPAVVAALLLDDLVETVFRSPLVVAVTLAGVGLLLLWGERRGRHNRDFWSLTMTDALLIGLAQACAIVPGTSRSGITMTAGLFRGLNRQAVARFSFLLSAPIIAGAGVYKLPEVLQNGMAPGQGAFYVTGFLTSAVSGYCFIAFLLRFVRTNTFDIFAYYRIVLAALVVAALFLG